MKNLPKSVKIVALAVFVALVFRYLFGIDSWSNFYTLMSITFIVLIPYVVGVITIYLSPEEKYISRSYSFFFPFVPIFAFFFVTLLLSIEGFACWVMILPIFLIFAGLGGLTARYFRLRKSKRTNTLHLSIAVLLPFLLSPVEQLIGSIPGYYTAYTYIDITAPKEVIWGHVTRVSEIQPSEDQSGLTKLLEIPRPIKAELNYDGVGADREAIFDKGLIFHEHVLQYEDQKLMTFSIKANTYDIPSTTFDEHILIGGNYFDVLEGTYRLERLNDSMYRLHLYSKFKISTTFNFYAGIWGKLIMKDIQNNILQVIKERCEVK